MSFPFPYLLFGVIRESQSGRRNWVVINWTFRTNWECNYSLKARYSSAFLDTSLTSVTIALFALKKQSSLTTKCIETERALYDKPPPYFFSLIVSVCTIKICWTLDMKINENYLWQKYAIILGECKFHGNYWEIRLVVCLQIRKISF